MALPMKAENNINLHSCLNNNNCYFKQDCKLILLLPVIHTIMSESSSFSTDSGINTIKEE